MPMLYDTEICYIVTFMCQSWLMAHDISVPCLVSAAVYAPVLSGRQKVRTIRTGKRLPAKSGPTHSQRMRLW